MKIYKYKLDTLSVRKIDEYIVEVNLKELDYFLDEKVIFVFNNEDDIYKIDDELFNDFLNNVRFEMIILSKEIISNLIDILIERESLNDQIYQNKLQLKKIINNIK